MLEIFEIWICQVFEFAGHQKLPALAACKPQIVMSVVKISVDIYDNLYLILYDRIRLDVVFMSITNESPYVRFYVIFIPRRGSLHHPSLTAPEEASLCSYRHPLHIYTLFHRGVLHIYHFSPISVIPVSANMCLVLTA